MVGVELEGLDLDFDILPTDISIGSKTSNIDIRLEEPDFQTSDEMISEAVKELERVLGV